MRISNDNIIRSNWRAINTTTSRTVSTTREIKTVYLQISNADESTSYVVTDTIILDAVPTMNWTGATPADNAWIQGNDFDSSLDIFTTNMTDFTRNRSGNEVSLYDSGLVFMSNFDRVEALGE